MRTRYLIGSIAAAAAAGVMLAPVASAEPQEISDTPACTTVQGGEYTGTTTTECQSPGNVQIDATAPTPIYPWADDFFGPALMIGDN
jgi:hypothetical protein